ncbi:MAG: hypothetical protein E7161_05090 [Firmicutes bacterium]|nr:hypothetical protein [Bacillota bacterium]
MLTHKTPRLDLHGEEKALVYALVTEFINDNYKMRNKEIVVIHGKSTNILTKEVHDVLKENKLVEKFSLNNWNVGETIIYLK